ncbi:MAG TPA: ATP-binding protein [Steroidobacteraceae bacterium]|nr:ATP-binding protein [Steroidobacteraceae bacterium]
MSAPTRIPRDQLPDWARAALEDSTPAPPARITDEMRSLPGWSLLLDAAVVSTFLPKDLAPDTGTGESRRELERFVLSFSQTACSSQGAAWELTRGARTAVLAAAVRAGQLTTAVHRTAKRFGDTLSTALRETLVNEPLDTSDLPPLESLEARRTAISLLSGVSELKLPSLDDLDRDIRRRRLIEQFERMCGKDYETRIVGRDHELEEMREYVGSINAVSLGQVITRTIVRSRRAITGRGTYVIWGTGGVGKTTLIARFMLEHMYAAEKNFPFAYLDFDRPSVSPRDPFGLLAEICLQVSSQFKDLDAALRELRGDILAAQPREMNPEHDPLYALVPLAERFRNIIDTFLNKQETRFEWARPFLLVFDTFEVVQYDVRQVALLQRFVETLSESGDWPRLRLMISGRRKLAAFMGPAEGRELEGVDLEGAQTLLSRWTARVGKPISDRNALVLARALGIKRRMLEAPRVHPLRLTMAANLFHISEETDGDAIAESLIVDLADESAGDTTIGRQLIDGILIRRIIDHANDDRVKRLADPGLVVRRITPDMIRFVMAKGSPAPGVELPKDSLDFERWEISATEADDIYEAFGREGTLVEREGNALRHRQDVRSEMLPLIRANSRKRFDLLHRLAFDHLRKEASQDDDACAEAIYHGLWINESLELVDSLWLHLDADPRIDPEEFPPDSLAAIYLRARNRERLELHEVKQLPRGIAMRWVVSFGHQFLLSELPNDELAIIRAACGGNLMLLREWPEASAVVAQLLFRAGFWRDARYHIQDLANVRLQPTTQSALMRITVNMAATAGGHPDDLGKPDRFLLGIPDPDVAAELIAYCFLGRGRAQTPGEGAVWQPVADKATGASPFAKRSQHGVRLALLAAASPVPGDLAAAWVINCHRLPRDAGIGPPLVRIFDTLMKAGHENVASDARSVRGITGAEEFSRGALDDLDVIWHRHQRTIAESARTDAAMAWRIRAIAVFDHSEWHQLLGHALERALDAEGSMLIDVLRQNRFLGMSGNSRDTADAAVKTAVMTGRFLQLAYLLADPAKARADAAAPLRPQEREEFRGYPQSVAGIAVALTGWHEYLLGRAEGEPEPPPGAPAPKKKLRK